MTWVALGFWPRITGDDPLGCWEWTGARGSDGYGHWTHGEKTVRVHRYAYEQLIGPIPSGMQIDHLCRNLKCVNPAHLEAVTKQENQRRGIKGVMTTRCPKGHVYDETNTYVYEGRRHCRACNRALKRKVSR